MLNSVSTILINYIFYGGFSWLNEVYNTLPDILLYMVAAVGAVGTVYAIILGVNMAKSDSDEKRKTAANRLKNTIIGVVVLIVLVAFLNYILPLIINAGWNDLVKLPYDWDPEVKF